MQQPVIVGAVRTPIGKFLGTLSGFQATDLGARVVAEVIRRSGLDVEQIDEVIMGNVVGAGLGQNPARQAALGADLPDSIAAVTINKVCGSSLKSAMLAAQAIKCGDADIIVAGGMESMSNAPYLLKGGRTGLRMGHGKMLDSMIHDGLWDVYNDYHMGNTGEVVAERWEVGREQQDAWALQSHQRALAAIDDGKFKAEILPVEVPRRKQDPILFDTDESPRRDTSLESLGRLRAAFKKGGTVTAGNAPGVNDGASAVAITSAAKAKELGLNARARIVSYATSGLAPELVMMAPEKAVRMVWEKTGWTDADVDLYEFNEAFSVQQIALGKELGISAEKHNVLGGAVALGHPIGASGARVLTTLLHALEDRNQKRGIAALCLGGGNAVAMGIERD
ncbi:MAG: acetyl-CoA C-acetyltransferase [Acidobacteriota bacterium]|nr:acetyl-CoA C-acetyltransferase [Acidobacteriota bacterium]MDH3784447.1 acetyl-CoA C-acetyltransferase [Acidobacteriota bacterium]